MDFSLTEEQSMLEDSVARFVDNDYDFETRQKIAATDTGYSAEVWQVFADLGWTAMPFREEDGGLGGGPVELMLMMQQFGRGLVVEPFLATVVLAGGILYRTASSEQRSRWLTPIITGELQAALAFAEPQGRFDPADIKTTATANEQGYVLNGHKALVLNGGRADLLVVPARTSGNRGDRDGITLFAVPGDSHGLSRKGYRLVDGHSGAEVWLQDTHLTADHVLGEVGGGYESLSATLDEGLLAVCAEAVGIQRALQEKTVDYSKSRIQFGVPIGSFQALQHRMVEMLMATEQCRSLLYWATMLAEAGSAEAPAAISALKHEIGTSGRRVAQEAVQIHGGMGVTWELDVAHYFKRFSTLETMFGNADWHLDRYLTLSIGSS